MFSKVYCIDNEDHEILMMVDYKEVVKGYTITVGEITEEQQRDLIKIFEKRIAADETQIRHDYFDMKKADKGDMMLAFVANPNSPQVEETWMTCVYRFCKTLAVAHQALFKVAQYGDTSIVHTFPPTSVKSTASAVGWSGPSNSAASASSRSTSDLVQQRSERRAYSTDPTECQCCGFATHRVADCPFKGLHDTNNQYHVLWGESAMGKAWMAEGHDTFVEHLYLPGWELRRKKRAEESSEDADTSKRVRYNSESEGNRPARDRRTLQERERGPRSE